MGSTGFQKHSGLAMNGSWRQTFLVDVPGIALLFSDKKFAHWLGQALLQTAFTQHEATEVAAN